MPPCIPYTLFPISPELWKEQGQIQKGNFSKCDARPWYAPQISSPNHLLLIKRYSCCWKSCCRSKCYLQHVELSLQAVVPPNDILVHLCSLCQLHSLGVHLQAGRIGLWRKGKGFQLGTLCSCWRSVPAMEVVQLHTPLSTPPHTIHTPHVSCSYYLLDAMAPSGHVTRWKAPCHCV